MTTAFQMQNLIRLQCDANDNDVFVQIANCTLLKRVFLNIYLITNKPSGLSTSIEKYIFQKLDFYELIG